MRMKTLRWIGTLGVAFATQACVVREAPSVNAGYYPGGRTASVGVATPQPYAVSTMPPDPLFEQMTPSPGMGHVWIDGSWHWNGYEWVWVSGRWEQDQAEHVYVQPYYDYSGDTYVYTPGYWSSRDRLPRGTIVRDHRDGRPSYVSPTPRPPRPPGAQPTPQPRDPYRPPGPPATRHPGGRDLVGPTDGPITAPRPPIYDPNGGGTYRPSRNQGYRPPAPANDGYQPPARGDVGGMPSTPLDGRGPVPAGGYGPPAPPPQRQPSYDRPAPYQPPPNYAPPSRQPQGYQPPVRQPPSNYQPPARQPTYAPPARPAPQQGQPTRTAPPPPPPTRTAPPPPSNTTPQRGRR